MKRILRGVPRMRNAMLLGVAGLAARIPDDTPEVIHPGTNSQKCILYMKLRQDQLCNARVFMLLLNSAVVEQHDTPEKYLCLLRQICKRRF